MPQKTNHIRTAIILFPGNLQQPNRVKKKIMREASLDLIVHFNKVIQAR